LELEDVVIMITTSSNSNGKFFRQEFLYYVFDLQAEIIELDFV